jgi:hypothetical protein
MMMTGENPENPVPVPLCTPQISHGLTWDRARASAVRGQRLTAWAMVRLIAPGTTSTQQGRHNTHPKVNVTDL